MEALAGKASVRILNDTERRGLIEPERDYKRVLGGLLVQDRDWDLARASAHGRRLRRGGRTRPGATSTSRTAS